MIILIDHFSYSYGKEGQFGYKAKTLNTIGSLLVHMVQNRNNIELEIVHYLVKKEMHVRELARILDEPHSTVSRRLNSLYCKQVVDFEKKGRNKVYFVKKNMFSKVYMLTSELYVLEKTLTKYPHLRVIFADIKTDSMVILFGSYAKGTARKNSDIDLYVEEKIEKTLSGINVKSGRFDKNSALIQEIIKNHVIVKGFEEYYDKIFGEIKTGGKVKSY